MVATAELSFEVTCNDSCDSCAPGLTGPLCDSSIDDCDSVECGDNQQCVDGHLNFSCVCEPGYTGPDCLTTVVDPCEGVQCSNRGECVNIDQSFSCLCQPFYTGELCEIQLNGYELLVRIDSYRNPERLCAGCDGCCDNNCNADLCDTFFYLCTRPFESEEVESILARQGNCLPDETVTTSPDINSAGRVFTSFVLNVSNPIHFSRIPEVCIHVVK